MLIFKHFGVKKRHFPWTILCFKTAVPFTSALPTPANYNSDFSS